jgi:hypothetical protein
MFKFKHQILKMIKFKMNINYLKTNKYNQIKINKTNLRNSLFNKKNYKILIIIKQILNKMNKNNNLMK